jgi:AcrR family transcriptional regulator
MPPGAAPEHKERPRYQRRLLEVLKASARVFAEEGYEKASVRRISRELGKSLSALYYYVDTKEELLYQIQLETFTSLADELEKLRDSSLNAVEHLRLLIRNHVGHFVKHIDELKVCAHEMESLSGEAYDDILTVRRRYFLTARGIVGEALKRYRNTALDPSLATLNLFGMLNWIYMWYDPQLNRSADALADQITRLFLFGLAGEEPSEAELGGREEKT